MALDITNLPPPQVIEQFDYEQIVARQKATFQDVWETIRQDNPSLSLPDYDVAMLVTDPVVIGIEAESYREDLLRARINDALKATLLAFARGNDLDNLAFFYDVSRMAGELDDRLVQRVILAIQGRSTGGTEPRYKFIAMSADIRVRDAVVYTEGRSPLIRVAVFSTTPGGVASADTLANVNAALQNPAVKMVNDTIVVASAVQQVVDIEADVWLLPDADATTTLTAAEVNLRAAWAVAQGLGRDLTTSWWSAKLMIEGVHKATPVTPSSDTVAPPAQAIAIGTVKLNNKGRAY